VVSGSTQPPPGMIVWLLLTFTALAESSFQTRRSHSCPDLCSCSLTASGANVLCNQSSLTYFPEHGLPPNTTHLSFQGTQLSNITAGHLSAVPFLTYLRLYYNNLTSLPPELPVVVSYLNELDLSGNQLVHLPPNVFSHASLYSSLTFLDLSWNRLTSIPATLLHKLPNLEVLDLSDNNLQELQEDTKSSFGVILSGNPWECDGKIEYLWKWLSDRLQNVFFLNEVTCGGPKALRDQQIVSLTETCGSAWAVQWLSLAADLFWMCLNISLFSLSLVSSFMLSVNISSCTHTLFL
uniref:LRRCT domain-containing protein n=1 Tax=Acanthochromis polyacanthus TaxID=80966 RepID=A0A3Q1F3C8_9TELE